MLILELGVVGCFALTALAYHAPTFREGLKARGIGPLTVLVILVGAQILFAAIMPGGGFAHKWLLWLALALAIVALIGVFKHTDLERGGWKQ